MTDTLQVGATVPDFELPDDLGTMHRLSELQGDNPMILMLARGEHCPRERQHQREMVKLYDFCPVAFTEMVSIFPNSQHDDAPATEPSENRDRWFGPCKEGDPEADGTQSGDETDPPSSVRHHGARGGQ